MHSKFQSIVTTLAFLTLSAGVASAGTIYSDNFTGPSGEMLSGLTVQSSQTYAGGTAGATWTAATGVTESGSASVNDAVQSAAFLPFTPQSGFIYTLQATLTAETTGSFSDWQALGFTDGTTTSGQWHTINSPSSWGLIDYTGFRPQFFPGPGTNGGAPYGTTADSGTQTLTITLNTTAASWVTSATVAGSGDTSGPISYSTNPTITEVGFGTDNLGGVVSGFSLNAVNAVPDPNSLAFLALGSAALVLMGRRVVARRII